MNLDTLGAIRKQAGAAYDTVRNAGTVQAGEKYTNALDTILKNTTGQAKSFPGLKNNEIEDTLNTLRQTSFDAGDAVDATRFLRNMADKAYASGDKQVAGAYKQASAALEDSLESHLESIGNPEALANFRNARQTIAKTYSVQKAMNPATGDIEAMKLATQMNKGKPLSGGLKDVAQLANAFPKDVQHLKQPYQGVTALDFLTGAATGTLGSALTGSPFGVAAAAIPLARNVTRSTLLSKPAQSISRNLGQNNYLSDFAQAGILPLAKSPKALSLSRLAGTKYGRDEED